MKEHSGRSDAISKGDVRLGEQRHNEISTLLEPQAPEVAMEQ